MKTYWKWIALLAVLLALELAPGPTLSEEAWHGVALHVWLRWVIVGAGVLLVGHLAFGWIRRAGPRQRLVLLPLAAAVSASACLWPNARPHTPTPPAGPVALTVQVRQDGAPIGGALITEIGGTPTGPYGRTDTAGQLVLTLEPQDFTVCAERDDANATPRICAGVRLHAAMTVAIDLPARPKPPRATGDRLLDFRGCLGNIRDAEGRTVWTPALPGASDAVWSEWTALLRANGCTHVMIGGFTGGPSYPGVEWSNPDLTQNAPALRALIERLLDTPAADGYGFRPVVFADNGDPRNPKPRLDTVFPTLAQALEGLDDYVIVVPAGWEPVVGAYTSAEVSYALQHWHAYRPRSLIGYHGSPGRLVGSSNPGEPDDPWRQWSWRRCINGVPALDEHGREIWDTGSGIGDDAEADRAAHPTSCGLPGRWGGAEAAFYKTAGGEYIQIALYQTPHGRELYRDCSEDDESGSCWLNRWQDYVQRIGGGLNGWRVLKLVLFETCTYEFFHRQTDDQGRPVEAGQCTTLADRGQRVAQKWGVQIGFGNGLPASMRP
jgi:hypothetical protein